MRNSSVLLILAGIASLLAIPARAAAGPTLYLQELIDEALLNNHEIVMTQARTEAARHRIPQAESLDDPMVMFGYQNEGFESITYSEMPDSQFMFSASQMLPFPGKRALRGDMAREEAGSFQAAAGTVRLTTVRAVTEIFYDLFFSYKNLDIIEERKILFARLEDAASARYGSGMGALDEVVRAQTEKYMLLERETMQRQRIETLEAMLDNVIGREEAIPWGVPAEPQSSGLVYSLEEAIALALQHSPAITAKERMIAAAEAKVKLAEKDYFPDFTVTGTVAEKGSDFEDMWSLTTSINVPIYHRTKQGEAVREAKAQLREAQHDLRATQQMLTAALKENYAMVKSAEDLMGLYQGGLIPKTYQDFEVAMSGYMTGRTESFLVIDRLKALIDFELLYWERFTERGKAVARITAAIGIEEPAPGSPPAKESH